MVVGEQNIYPSKKSYANGAQYSTVYSLQSKTSLVTDYHTIHKAYAIHSQTLAAKSLFSSLRKKTTQNLLFPPLLSMFSSSTYKIRANASRGGKYHKPTYFASLCTVSKSSETNIKQIPSEKPTGNSKLASCVNGDFKGSRHERFSRWYDNNFSTSCHENTMNIFCHYMGLGAVGKLTKPPAEKDEKDLATATLKDFTKTERYKAMAAQRATIPPVGGDASKDGKIKGKAATTGEAEKATNTAGEIGKPTTTGEAEKPTTEKKATTGLY